jgi:hypothetical protein
MKNNSWQPKTLSLSSDEGELLLMKMMMLSENQSS